MVGIFSAFLAEKRNFGRELVFSAVTFLFFAAICCADTTVSGHIVQDKDTSTLIC